MSQFLGTHQNRLDAKGRVSIPAPFRAALRKSEGAPAAMVLRQSHKHPCIEVWPPDVFHALAGPLDQLDIFSDDEDDLTTTLYASAYEVEADKEGRIILPESLVHYANLTDTVTFMGMRRQFQIWEPAAAVRRKQEAAQRAESRGLTLAPSRRPQALDA